MQTFNSYNRNSKSQNSPSAFGSIVTERSQSFGSGYKYGMNTQESEPELGNGMYSAEFWIYDGKLGRRWNVDPLIKAYESSYACFGNNPIWIIDLNGADSTIYIYKESKAFGSRDNKTNNNAYKKRVEKNLIKNGYTGFKVEFVNSDSKLKIKGFSETDHFVYIHKYDKTQDPYVMGYTNPNDPYTSHIYAGSQKFTEFSVVWTRRLASSTMHEITHGFLQRATHYFGVNEQNLGANKDFHYEAGTKLWIGLQEVIIPMNLMNSGDRIGQIRAEDEEYKPDEFKKSELMLKIHKIVIHNFLMSLNNENNPKTQWNPYLNEKIKKSTINSIKNDAGAYQSFE